jgi:hypothetical protein
MRTFAVMGAMVMFLGAFSGMAHGMPPLDSFHPDADNDKDGLKNGQEYLWGTDPIDPDSDGDGCPDGWEIWYDTHRAGKDVQRPLIDPHYHFDANYDGDGGYVHFYNHNKRDLYLIRDNDASVLTNDPDYDGWNNLHEFLVGSDPTNPNTDGDCYPQDSMDPDPFVNNDNDDPNTVIIDSMISDHAHPDRGNTGGGGSGIGAVVYIL